MLFNRETVKYQDKLYWVYRKLKQDQFKERFVQEIREYWGCDLVLKQKTPQGEVFLFIVEIPDLEIVT